MNKSKSILLEGASEDLLKIVLDIQAATPPLRSLAELVQNSIDAGAQNINVRLFTEKEGKKKITKYVEIEDDGPGFMESFEHYCKNIGNSIKKSVNEYLVRKERGESIGEFCIGLQSFRSVASELHIINITKENLKPVDKNGNLVDDPDFPKMYKLRRLKLFKTKISGEIDEEGEIDIKRKSHGVTYRLLGLTSQAQKAFTIKNIASYLSQNKRTILQSNKNLKINIIEGTNKILVKPPKHRGERVVYEIGLPHRKDVSRAGFGNIKAELYYQSAPSNDAKIALLVGGEPVYNDICSDIPGFDRDPWRSGYVEGTIEYNRLQKTGNRMDVVKDDYWDAFIEMLYELEREVNKKVEEIKKGYQSKKYKNLIKKLEDVFFHVKREVDLNIWFNKSAKTPISKGSLDKLEVLPEKANIQAFATRILHARAYDSDGNMLTPSDNVRFYWEVTGKLGKIIPHYDDATFEAGSIVGTTQVLVKAVDEETQKSLSCKIDIVITHPIRAGPLFRVKAIPGFLTVPLNRQREIRAVAEDKDGNQIIKHVKFEWAILYDESGDSELNWPTGDSVIFKPGKEVGQVKLGLKAQQYNITKEDFVIISVIPEEKPKKIRPKKNLGLPQPQDYNDPTEFPLRHSYLTKDGKFLRYNTAHPDYKDADRIGEKRRQRYIANLMAKELAYQDCKATGQMENFGEKFLDIISKIDKHWK